MDLLDIFGVHTIEVTPPSGEGAYGPIPGVPRPESRVFVTEKVILVRNSAGDQITSTAQIATRLDVQIDPDGTLIKLPSGRSTKVISVSRGEAGDLPLPQHQVIYCE